MSGKSMASGKNQTIEFANAEGNLSISFKKT